MNPKRREETLHPKALKRFPLRNVEMRTAKRHKESPSSTFTPREKTCAPERCMKASVSNQETWRGNRGPLPTQSTTKKKEKEVLTVSMTRMFPFITKTWNPLGGKCPYDCIYCWAGELAKRYDMSKYAGPHRLYMKELKRNFKETDFVFVQDMSDLFAKTVPNAMIQAILNRIKEFPKTKFLLLTKNPIRYHAFHIPKNCVCGATIETDFPPESYGKQVSKAPSVRDRIYWMIQLKHTKMVAIEPVLDFSPESFFTDITLIEPAFIAIGFDNYSNSLPEPESLEKVQEFINRLEKAGIMVYKKTLREPVELEIA